ncbi:universal stress protein [Tolypothrix sp. VBCCA 56010]|uniref:universal stress protein n=1 Tax=Tolypothrix sp. VBCCA 56010 TaxID=3137731 RepID=UPI003D7E9E71
MLVRLQSAIGRDDLIEQMVLLSPKTSCAEKAQPAKSVNLIVGYNSSPNSHTALDMAFWIAHQTRLATNVQVIVQAVYVVEENQKNQYLDVFHSEMHEPSLACPVNYASKSTTSVLSQPQLTSNALSLETKLTDNLTQADRILWQARSLAEEWQGSFKAHLRFGCVAEELQKVVKLEAADILFLGCQSINHPIIQTLDSDLPCVVLGIPNCINI